MALPKHRIDLAVLFEEDRLTDLADQLSKLVEVGFIRVRCDAQFTNSNTKFLRSFERIPLVQFLLVLFEKFDVFDQSTFDVFVEEKLGKHVEFLSEVLVGKIDLKGRIR